MARKRANVSDSYVKCGKCGTKNTLYRNSGLRKEEGHIKDLWCFKCKDKTHHIESKYGFKFEEQSI